MAKYWKIINQSGHTGRNTPSTHRSFTFWSGGQIRGDWETIFWNQKWINPFFTKMGQSRPLFVYFRSFYIPIQMTNMQFEQYKLNISSFCKPRFWHKIWFFLCSDHLRNSISDTNSSKSDSSSLFSILKSSDEFMQSGDSLHSSDLDKVKRHLLYNLNIQG